MKRIAILIDGGYLRAIVKNNNRQYDASFIERFAANCRGQDEEIFRVLYYDCEPFDGIKRLPVSGIPHHFQSNSQWLTDLSKKDLFAIRKGVLKFRGFKPRRTPVGGIGPLTDADFKPDFEQKGVDMRIGLDIAVYSENRAVERIVLVSNDTDCAAALKHGRKAGLQVVIVELPGCRTAPELLFHSDFKRPVSWP